MEQLEHTICVKVRYFQNSKYIEKLKVFEKYRTFSGKSMVPPKVHFTHIIFLFWILYFVMDQII